MTERRGGYIQVFLLVNPLPDDKILDWFILKQIADDNFKFDENSRKLFKQVENTVGKGETSNLLCPQCFQKACFLEASKGVIVWELVKWHQIRLSLPETNYGSCH